MAESGQLTGQIRALVVIASYGQKNLPFLRRIIQTYLGMSMDVDVVVCSEAPKELGPEVKVIVGLPSCNPWSLPFAHKAVFAENAERYDVFIYTEDDMEVGEDKIHYFLRAAAVMEPDEIPGFLRYEVAPDGTKLLTDVHGAFHWKAESVRRRGDYTVAEFSNEHAGFYILTRAQLKRAIASGGFLRAPYEGRYGLPETAATDPYMCCGFRKVICISALEKFLIRHMSNLYVGRLDVSLASFQEQIRTLTQIREGLHPATTLWQFEPKSWHSWWQKGYYEKPDGELLSMVPGDAQTILSIGCGWGATEARLVERGAVVTAFPLDSVIGAVAAKRGVEVIHGTWDQCLEALGERRFDCVLVANLLHLLPSPGDVLRQCARFVQAGGTLVSSGPNFDRVPWLLKRVFGASEFRDFRHFELSGISVCGPGTLATALKAAGLRVSALRWLNHSIDGGWLRGTRIPLGRLTARDWLLQARR
jgi:2-polyprenyl-3-methyl-5-hydroxy-6-metoxy-1,4-benzoquinol methylase